MSGAVTCRPRLDQLVLQLPRRSVVDPTQPSARAAPCSHDSRGERQPVVRCDAPGRSFDGCRSPSVGVPSDRAAARSPDRALTPRRTRHEGTSVGQPAGRDVHAGHLLVQATPASAAGTRWGSKLSTSVHPKTLPAVLRRRWRAASHLLLDVPPRLQPTAVATRPPRTAMSARCASSRATRVASTSSSAGSARTRTSRATTRPRSAGPAQDLVRGRPGMRRGPTPSKPINIPDVYVYKNEYFGVRDQEPQVPSAAARASAPRSVRPAPRQWRLLPRSRRRANGVSD